ncbi:MAG TPA: PQQ-binding-like beta-propeller repeat protein [Ktedonobacteraceae bacterium]
MPADDEFFTPEEVDEQIDFLAQQPEQGDESALPAARIISHLQQFYPVKPEKQMYTLERAWERIVAEHRQAKQTSHEKGHLISMQEYQNEQQTLNSKRAAQKRAFVQRLSVLAAVAFIGMLVGGMVLLLNTARQVQKPNTKNRVQVASGGTPLPTPPHPIIGGKCTLDTTVVHPQQSKTSVPGLYIFASNIQSDNILYRYDPHTKKVLWSKNFCGAFESNGTVEQNGILYLAGGDWTHESGSGVVSYLYALNESDGSVIWGMQFPTSVTPFAKSSPNYGSSPLDLGAIGTPTVVNGITYVVQRTGIVYAFDAATGKQLWTFDTGQNAWATTSQGNGSIVDPSSIQVVNGVAYGSIVDRIFALDAKSGKKLWMSSFNKALNISQSPAIADGTIYLTTYVPGYGSVANPDTYIYAFDTQTGSQKWKSVKMRGYINGPMALNGKVYALAYDGTWYTLSASNGAIEAQKPLPNDGVSSPTLINGVLYSITDTRLSVLNPDGSAKWSVPVTEKYPFIDDVQGGIIYVTGRGSGIYAYNATNGALLWHYEGYLPQPEGIVLVTIVPQV